MGSSQLEQGVTIASPQPSCDGRYADVELQARYSAARVGGDFFDCMMVGSHVLFVLSDIAGRRIVADPIAAEVQETFRRKGTELFGAATVNESEAIADLVHEVNASLMSAADGVHYAPSFFGCYNLTLAVLTYINAGGQTGLVRDVDGTRPLENGGMPLGLFTHMTHEPAVQAFEPGARMLIVTKGVIDSARGRGRFGVERLNTLLKEDKSDSAEKLCEATLEAVAAFKKGGDTLIGNFLSKKPKNGEDMTAVAMVRSLPDGRTKNKA
jgi:serine phosphatase RsbU (regulator of sigma subunit)